MSKRNGSRRDQPRDEVIQELFEQVRKIVDLAKHLFLHFNQQPVARHQKDPPERDEPAPATAASAHTERLAYTLKEVSDLVGLSRSALYEAIGDGHLRAVKCGRRTLVLSQDLQDWLGKLPTAQQKV